MFAAILTRARRGRDGSPLVDRLRGPAHRVAGYTEVPGGIFRPSLVEVDSAVSSALFGDYVTACGLTLPRFSVTASTERPWLGSPSRCGDCLPDHVRDVLERHEQAFGDEHDEDCPLCGIA